MCKRTWVQVLCMPMVCYLILLFLMMCLERDLVELVVHFNCNCVGMGSNLGLNKTNFLFAKHYFWQGCEEA